jgi:hypothetical protein
VSVYSGEIAIANDATPDPLESILVLTSPNWVVAFVTLAMAISLVPFSAGFLLGLSVASDVVFGFYALTSGLAADAILRAKFRKALLAWQQPRIPLIALWAVLCFYVIVFQPLD